MKESIQHKLQNLVERHEELGALMNDASIIAQQNKFRELSKEYAQLEPVVQHFKKYQELEKNYVNAQEMLRDPDPEIRAMAAEEINAAKTELEQSEQQLQILLIPKDPDDSSNVYLEIRAGAGGDEASIFAGDLFRMYSRYAEAQGWQIEVVNTSQGEHGGYKEIISRVTGTDVYAQLKFESGAHRVQRVPKTEAQGRVHTSTCTVAVIPEVDEVDSVDINPADLRIDTYRSSGAGGQHVNKTDSAIRITHIPTGVVVECQEERSQHKNRAKALSLLKSRLLAAEKEKQATEQAATRKSLVGTGDRSERIRTYNYSQGRVTDHRINLTLYKLPEIMEGDIGSVIQPLIQEHQTEQLTALGQQN